MLVRGRASVLTGSWPSALALFVYAAGFSYAYVKLPTAVGALILFGAVQTTMIGYGLWTGERMKKIVAALKRKDLAVEINDLARTPHERFINMAKEQGLKFTFGSDTRDQKAGRLDFCKYVAKKCNLKKDDFFLPKRVLNRA